MKRFLSCGHERDLLLTELAHDLRNLLSAILGGLNLLHTSLQSDKTKRRPCHAARQNPCCRRRIRRSPDRQGVWREQNDDWGQLSEEAFLHDFAGDLPPEEARVLYATCGLHSLRQIKQGDEPAIKYDRNDKPFQHLDLRKYL